MIREMPSGSAAPGVSELDVLLDEAGQRGFMWYMFRADRYGPEALAGVYQHSGCADVVVLTGAMHAHAYRMPTGTATDVFAPIRVYWWYGAAPVWTLRALLTLARPDDQHSSFPLLPVPPGFGIAGNRVPVRMRRRLNR